MTSVLIVESDAFVKTSLQDGFSKNSLFNLIFLSTMAETKNYLEEKATPIHVAIVAITLEDAPNGEIVDYVLSYEIPVIVLTSILSDQIMDKYSSKPIIDYLSKNSLQDILYTVEIVETLYYIKNRKALIVEDSKSTQLYISLYFKAIMMDAIFASSGEEAVGMLLEHDDVDIITVDFMMPGMNGLEFVQKIKSKFPYKDLNIIAITSQTDANTVSKFLKSGAADFLGKPFSKEEFNARVIKMLSYVRKLDEIKRYSHAIEQYIVTSETDDRGVIRKVSQSFSDLSGYSKKELIGNTHRLVRHPDMPAEVFEDLWATIIRGEVWEGEIKNRKKDGSYYWVKASISPLYKHGTKEIIGYQSSRRDITDKKLVEEKSSLLEAAQKKVTDSIEFSSIIQKAFLPKDLKLQGAFEEHFVFWQPKDIVGGDMYDLMEFSKGYLLFIIDCTGHGVPGAFMTMIVKTSLDAIVNEKNYTNPALILHELNKRIKGTLNQYNIDAQSDAGLDGGILYYSKVDNLIRYAGAKTPLFYIQEGELKVFKSDRTSIGYRKSDPNYQFTNYDISIESPLNIYITTDGVLDQNGGEEGFPYGKSKFQKLLQTHYKKSFQEQKSVYLEAFAEYQGAYERDDDITFLGIKVVPVSQMSSKTDQIHYNDVSFFVDKSINPIFDHYGLMHQKDIATAEEKIREVFKSSLNNTGKLEVLLTIVYETGQNLMRYAVEDTMNDDRYMYDTYFKIGRINTRDTFYIQSGNIVSNVAKQRIEERMNMIVDLDRKEVKELYKELRKSRRYSHSEGAGLGFLELAKRVSQRMQFAMHPINEHYSYYTLNLRV